MNPSQDWSPPRTTHAFTGYSEEDKAVGLVVRFLTHTPIPMSEDDRLESNQKRVTGTIIGFPKLGFGSAPYAKKSSKPGKANKGKDKPSVKGRPLLEPHSLHESTGEVMSVKMYNYHKASSNFDKGDRDEASTSILAVGQVLSFGLSEYTFGGDKPMFPEGTRGFIEENTMVDLTLTPSHNQAGGYGCKMSKVAPHASTLYSYMRASGLETLRGTADAARSFCEEQAEKCAPVTNCVDRSRFSLYGNVNTSAKVVDMRADLDFVRIECPRGSGQTPLPGVPSVDVAFKDLLRFTNCPGDTTSARTLVDLAIASGSLFMFVTHDGYNNKQEPALSTFRGVPLIDANLFLHPVDGGALEESALDAGQESVLFAAPWSVPQDAELKSIGFQVGAIPKSQEEGVAPPCPDLSIVSAACSFKRGYRVYVGNPGTEGEDDSYYVLGFFYNCGGANAEAQPGAGGGGKRTAFKRVRLEM